MDVEVREEHRLPEGSTNSSTSSGTGSSATEQSGASQTDVEQVTFKICMVGVGIPRHTATLEAIAAYEKQNPNVKIEAEYQGYDGYNDKILTQLAGGTQPDIMQTIATAAAEYQASFPDSFVNLDEQDIFDTSIISEEMLNSFCKSNDGNVVAVPTGVSSYKSGGK